MDFKLMKQVQSLAGPKKFDVMWLHCTVCMSIEDARLGFF